jgi:hypothetical protein
MSAIRINVLQTNPLLVGDYGKRTLEKLDKSFSELSSEDPHLPIDFATARHNSFLTIELDNFRREHKKEIEMRVAANLKNQSVQDNVRRVSNKESGSRASANCNAESIPDEFEREYRPELGSRALANRYDERIPDDYRREYRTEFERRGSTNFNYESVPSVPENFKHEFKNEFETANWNDETPVFSRSSSSVSCKPPRPPQAPARQAIPEDVIPEITVFC